MKAANPYLISTAQISDCGAYRYALERAWSIGTSRMLFVGLNPSTADWVSDDPTIRRCVHFAKREGHDGLLMGNLFAFRTKSPAELRKAPLPVGSENDYWLEKLAERATQVVLAWGNHGRLLGRDRLVAVKFKGADCFGITKDGQPIHPLYQRSNALLRAFAGIHP